MDFIVGLVVFLALGVLAILYGVIANDVHRALPRWMARIVGWAEGMLSEEDQEFFGWSAEAARLRAEVESGERTAVTAFAFAICIMPVAIPAGLQRRWRLVRLWPARFRKMNVSVRDDAPVPASQEVLRTLDRVRDEDGSMRGFVFGVAIAVTGVLIGSGIIALVAR